jgi:hypothetical protein
VKQRGSRGWPVYAAVLPALLWAAPSPLPAQVPPGATIRIESGVYGTGGVFLQFTGREAEARAAERILRQDLEFDGRIPLVAKREGAMLIAHGQVDGPSIHAKLAGANGQVLLERQLRPGPLTQAVHAFADTLVEKLAGSPGCAGTKIIFVSDRTGIPQLWMCDYDGGHPVQLTHDPRGAHRPELPRGGRRLSYLSGSAAHELNVATRQTKAVWGTFTPVAERQASSPDGKKRVSARQGRLYRENGAEVKTGFTACDAPDWSPDGRSLAFEAGGKIVVLDFASGRTRVVGNGFTPAWSPNSRHLAYSQEDRLVLVNVGTGRRMVLGKGHGQRLSEPRWLPATP